MTDTRMTTAEISVFSYETQTVTHFERFLLTPELVQSLLDAVEAMVAQLPPGRVTMTHTVTESGSIVIDIAPRRPKPTSPTFEEVFATPKVKEDFPPSQVDRAANQ